jgi:hypothetical protein
MNIRAPKLKGNMGQGALSREMVELYRERAALIREIIADMPPSKERDVLIEVAAHFDRLAETTAIRPNTSVT